MKCVSYKTFSSDKTHQSTLGSSPSIWLVCFYGISILVGYLMPNPHIYIYIYVYIYIYIYMYVCIYEDLAFATLRQDRACKRVIWWDGEYSNNILRRNKFIMTAYPSLSLHLIVLYTLWMWILLYPRE